MTLRQLIYLREVVKQGFNVSAASEALFTSQPSVSRQLQELVDELGVELFTRSGKRLTGLTDIGQQIVEISGELLANTKKIRNLAAAYRKESHGVVVIAATRHAVTNRLTAILSQFCHQEPDVNLMVHEEESKTIINLLIGGEADVGILSDRPYMHPYLAYFTIDEWRLTVVAPKDHELFTRQNLSLDDLAEFPISTYLPGAISRRVVEETFHTHYLMPHLAYSLGSSTLILKQVENGVGIGIVAESAFDPSEYPTLRSLDVGHLFRPLKTWVALRRKAYLQDYVYSFLKLLMPEIDRAAIDQEKDKPMTAH